MRNTTETIDGAEKLKLATVAAALLIPPIFMFIAAPTQPTTSAKASELSTPLHRKQMKPATPAASRSQPLVAPQSRLARHNNETDRDISNR